MSLFNRKTILDDDIHSLSNNMISIGIEDIYSGGATLIPDLFSVPDQPAAPDYAGLAEQTAASDLENARYATEANRPDMFTPYGSSTWTQDGDSWTNTVALSPEQQALFDQQQQTSQLSGDLAYQGLQNTGDMFSTPYKTGLDPMQSYDDMRDSYIDDRMARVNTDVGRDRSTKEAELIAAGIPKNSPAFDTEMERFDRRLTDAGEQANLFATQNISTMSADDRARRGQTVQEAMLERQTPLNELNALKTGGQLGTPQFNSFVQQQTTPGTDYLTAGMNQGSWDLAGWNADTAQNNAILGGLFGLGGAAIMGG